MTKISVASAYTQRRSTKGKPDLQKETEKGCVWWWWWWGERERERERERARDVWSPIGLRDHLHGLQEIIAMDSKRARERGLLAHVNKRRHTGIAAQICRHGYDQPMGED